MPTDCDVKQKSEPIWVLFTQSAKVLKLNSNPNQVEKTNPKILEWCMFDHDVAASMDSFYKNPPIKSRF